MIKYSLHINKGIWHVSFYLKDINGKRKQKQLSTGLKAYNGSKEVNKSKADKKAQEIVASFDGLTHSDCTNWTLDRYVADWLERDKSHISLTTYDKYVSMLNRHITPYFSKLGLPIREIKPIHLERYCAEKISEGLSPTTVIKHIGLIRPALKDAVKNAYIRLNPAELMQKPKKAKTETHYYNAEQLQTLLSVAMGTPIEVPVVLGIMLGLRRSEIVGLRWSAIDFDKMILSIRQKAITGMVDGKTQTVISTTLKTDASESDFKLNLELCSYLKALKEKQLSMPRETKAYMDYVCVNAVGDLLKPDYITSKFRKLLETNHLPPIRFHDLRHSCISLLANDSRFSMKQIQDYARHANFLTTANIYSHTDTDIKKDELDSITANFKGFFRNNS